MMARKMISVRLDTDLLTRVDAANDGSRTAFIERALEAALSDDTHGREPRGASIGHSDAGHHASATGAAAPRGASRPAASPRTSVRQDARDEYARMMRERQQRLNKQLGWSPPKDAA